MSQSGRAAWSVVTATAIGLSMWSLVDGATAGNGDPGCCVVGNGTGCVEVFTQTLCTAQNGTFSQDEVCSADNTSCREPVTGCCENLNATECFDDNGTELACILDGGNFFENEACVSAGQASAALSGVLSQCEPYTPTPSATASATSTPTATNTPTATYTASATDTATATPDGSETPTATATMIPDGGDCVDPTDCQSGNCVDDFCCESACDGPNEACNLPGLEGNCLALTATVPAASNTGLTMAVVGLLAVALAAFLRRRTAV